MIKSNDNLYIRFSNAINKPVLKSTNIFYGTVKSSGTEDGVSVSYILLDKTHNAIPIYNKKLLVGDRVAIKISNHIATVIGIFK